VNLKKLISIASVAVVLVLGTLIATSTSSNQNAEVFNPIAGELVAADAPAVGGNAVDVGLYGTNVYELSLPDNTFYFSGYVWLRWSNPDLDPVSGLEFVNAVETWGLMLTPLTESPEQLANGDFVQTLSVQGRFYKSFKLNDYPLDRQTLSIMLEDTTNTIDAIQYRADNEKSGLDPNFRVQGFEVLGLSAQNYEHSYGTDFGYTGTDAAQVYSTLEFQIQVERNPNLFIWKLLFPLLLVLITNWLTLLINPTHVEVRTAMPATALLTTVFLQQTALESISQTSVLVLMDKVYLVAYAAIVVTLIQVIRDNFKVKTASDEEVSSVHAADKVSLVIQVTVSVVALAALILPKLL
jgi:hypothetical protein